MRILLLLPLLAGCHRLADDAPGSPPTRDAALPTIPCTLGGAATDCTVEQIASPAGLVLLIGHPDGGFRRLLVAGGGRGVIAADGAAPAYVAAAGGQAIDVSIGGERYRFPATIGGAS